MITTQAKPQTDDNTLALVAGNIAAHLAGQSAGVLSGEEARQERIIAISISMARAIIERTAPPTVEQQPADPREVLS